MTAFVGASHRVHFGCAMLVAGVGYGTCHGGVVVLHVVSMGSASVIVVLKTAKRCCCMRAGKMVLLVVAWFAMQRLASCVLGCCSVLHWPYSVAAFVGRLAFAVRLRSSYWCCSDCSFVAAPASLPNLRPFASQTVTDVLMLLLLAGHHWI